VNSSANNNNKKKKKKKKKNKIKNQQDFSIHNSDRDIENLSDDEYI